tara:strand:+ start:302 stop:484 length:183 start_codon:yes stop_codon:yes gene_type:complete
MERGWRHKAFSSGGREYFRTTGFFNRGVGNQFAYNRELIVDAYAVKAIKFGFIFIFYFKN